MPLTQEQRDQLLAKFTLPGVAPLASPGESMLPAPMPLTSEPPPAAPELALAPMTPAAPQVETTTVSRPMTPQMQTALDMGVHAGDAVNQELAAQRATADADQARRDAAIKAQADASAKAYNDAKAEQERINKITEDTTAEITRQQAELANATPKTFWNKADTGDKILMSMALILGGVGQGLTGSKENMALTAMDRAIDQDLAIQEKKFQRRQALIDNSRADLKSKQEMSLKNLAAIEAWRQAAYDQANAQLELLKSKATTDEKRLKIAEVQGQIQSHQAELALGVAEKVAPMITTKTAGGAQQLVLPKDKQQALDTLAVSSGKTLTVLNELQAVQDQLKAAKNEDEQFLIMNNAIKTLNSSISPDAVSEGDAHRVAAFLTPSAGKILDRVSQGTTPAAMAAALGKGPLGLLLAGGTLAAAAGQGALEAAATPGGIRFAKDIPMGIKAFDLVVDKMRGTLARNELAQNAMRGGVDSARAMEMANQAVRKKGLMINTDATPDDFFEARKKAVK